MNDDNTHRPNSVSNGPNSNQSLVGLITEGQSSVVTNNDFNTAAMALSSPFESIVSSVQITHGNEMAEGNIFKSPTKPLVTRMRKRYRLIKKSPLKGSPIKNLNLILRKRRRKTKTKGFSPRKLQFILPKITKFSPKKVKYTRSFSGKSKLLPIVPRTVSSNTSVVSGGYQHQPHAVSTAIIRDESSHIKIAPKPHCKQDVQNAGTISEKDSVHTIKREVERKEIASSRILEDIEEDDEEDVDDSGQQQQEEHLAALLKASSTIVSQRACETREQKQQRRLQDRVASLAHVPDLKSQQDILVLNYLLQVKEALVDTKFEQFISLLNGIRLNSDPVEEVYYKIMELLKGSPDLQEFFVAFLRPDEAIRVGKYAEFCVIERMREFVDEFKYHFSKQPQNMQKVRRTLYTLLTQEQVNVEDIIATLRPLLKLQPWLIESLLQCIPSAAPKQSLPEDFEDIDLDCPNSPGDGFENINMVDEETRFTNTDSCACDCHYANTSSNSVEVSGASPPQTYKSEHCISCGLRFIDGRVYVRFGKALRLAKVIYLSENQGPKAGVEGLVGPLLSSKGKDEKAKTNSSKQSKLCHSKPGTDVDAEKPKKGRKTKKS